MGNKVIFIIALSNFIVLYPSTGVKPDVTWCVLGIYVREAPPNYCLDVGSA